MMVYSKYSSRKRGYKIRKIRSFPTRRAGLLVLIVTTSLLILLKLATWLNAQELFSLKDIKFEGNRFAKKSELLNLIKVEPSMSLLEFDTQKIANQVEQHPLIQRATVSRSLPSSLVIRVQEKEPIALLNNSVLTALDEKGQPMPVFQTEMFFDYPIISNIKLPEKNTGENGGLNQVIDFLNFTKTKHFALYSDISEIFYSKNSGIYFYLNEGATPVILGHGNLQNKNANLLEVLNLLKRENNLGKVKCFDLRFKNQVIVKEFLKS